MRHIDILRKKRKLVAFSFECKSFSIGNIGKCLQLYHQLQQHLQMDFLIKGKIERALTDKQKVNFQFELNRLGKIIKLFHQKTLKFVKQIPL